MFITIETQPAFSLHCVHYVDFATNGLSGYSFTTTTTIITVSCWHLQ